MVLEMKPDCNHIWKPAVSGLECETCETTSADQHKAEDIYHFEWISKVMNAAPGATVWAE